MLGDTCVERFDSISTRPSPDKRTRASRPGERDIENRCARVVSGFYPHHCVHYMDLIPWFTGEDFADMAIRKIEPKPGNLLLHLNFDGRNGAIGTIVMGTVQSRGTPMEFLQIMGDHVRVEVDNVINVACYRNPAFKAEDPQATLSDGSDTLSWTPNFNAAVNEDHKGYNALIADVAHALKGENSAAPDILAGVRALANRERMISLV